MKFLVYGLIANNDDSHDVRFVDYVVCEPHEDAIQHAVDQLIANKAATIAMTPEETDLDSWSRLGHEAVLAFPEDWLFQINSPTRRGMRLGFSTSTSRPRRMRVSGI